MLKGIVAVLLVLWYVFCILIPDLIERSSGNAEGNAAQELSAFSGYVGHGIAVICVCIFLYKWALPLFVATIWASYDNANRG